MAAGTPWIDGAAAVLSKCARRDGLAAPSASSAARCLSVRLVDRTSPRSPSGRRADRRMHTLAAHPERSTRKRPRRDTHRGAAERWHRDHRADRLLRNGDRPPWSGALTSSFAGAVNCRTDHGRFPPGRAVDIRRLERRSRQRRVRLGARGQRRNGRGRASCRHCWLGVRARNRHPVAGRQPSARVRGPDPARPGADTIALPVVDRVASTRTSTTGLAGHPAAVAISSEPRSSLSRMNRASAASSTLSRSRSAR